jgi:hypothetical protein
MLWLYRSNHLFLRRFEFRPRGPYFNALYTVHFGGLLDVQNILSADTGISRQTEGHSFSRSVSITPSSLIEASIVLCSDSMTRVSHCPISLRPEHPLLYSRALSRCTSSVNCVRIFPFHFTHKIISVTSFLFQLLCPKSAGQKIRKKPSVQL